MSRPLSERQWPSLLHNAMWAAIFAAYPWPPAEAMGQEQARDGAVQAFRAVRVETLVPEIEAGSGGLEVDSLGRVYTADFGSRLGPGGEGGHRVYRITVDGKVSLLASTLRGASGNTIDEQGNLYQSSIGGNTISRITPAGDVSVVCRAGLTNPVGVLLRPDGQLLVASCGSNSLVKVNAAGQAESWVQSPLLKCPNGICQDTEGNVYVANFMNGDVLRVSPEKEVRRLATLPGNNNGHLVFHRGYLYVVARKAHQIYRVSLAGDVALLAGSGERGQGDGPPAEATFSLPNDLAFSPDGAWLYVNEVVPVAGDHRILAPTRIRRIAVAPEPSSGESQQEPAGCR